MNKFSKTSLARRSGVDGRLVEISDLAIKICPIDFGIPGDGGIRTPERQQELFNEGLSKCDGFKNKSFHQTGLALDVYAYVDGAASWDTEHLAVVAVAMMQAANELGYKLEWGGLWTGFQDMPHFQLTEY